MGANTKIEWAHHTFNPWIGCTKVSPACDHCYAETLMDTRLKRVSWGVGQPRLRTGAKNWAEPEKWNAAAAAAGRRDRVFCASLADVFDGEVPDAWRTDLFRLIQRTPALDWLLLTKRTHLARRWWREHLLDEVQPNVWIGATVENQAAAVARIPHLLEIPARVHFLSCEPLLGPLDLRDVHRPIGESGEHVFDALECDVDPEDDEEWHGQTVRWVIAGGESGPGARPMHFQHVRDLRDQCQSAGVALHFKQWGEFDFHGVRVGKFAAGRELDGREWNEVPT